LAFIYFSTSILEKAFEAGIEKGIILGCFFFPTFELIHSRK